MHGVRESRYKGAQSEDCAVSGGEDCSGGRGGRRGGTIGGFSCTIRGFSYTIGGVSYTIDESTRALHRGGGGRCFTSCLEAALKV